VEFVDGTEMLKTGKIFAIIVKERGVGEEALKHSVKAALKVPVLVVPGAALGNHDVSSIQTALLRQTEDYGLGPFACEPNRSDIWATLSEVKKQLLTRPILWLDLMGTQMKYWALWRTGIEENLCSLVVVCKKTQWEKARGEIPEFTDSVFDRIELDVFIDRTDLQSLAELVPLYYDGELSGAQVDALMKRLERSPTSIREKDFEKQIWEIIIKGAKY